MIARENKSVSYESRKPFIREPIKYLIEPWHYWRDHALAYIHSKETTTVKRLCLFSRLYAVITPSVSIQFIGEVMTCSQVYC